MLYIDGLSLRKYITELNSILKNRKITRFVQYDRYTFSLFFTKLNLFISINPSMPVFFLSNVKDEAPSAPLSFSLSLKKYMENSILTEITQIGFDRIAVFNFDRITELGEKQKTKLVIELMGKHSNAFICENDNKIIDLMKKFSIEENSLRILMPGVYYKIPVITEKNSPDAITNEALKNFSSSELVSKYEGIGKFTASHMIENTTLPDMLLDDLNKPALYYRNNIVAVGSLFTLSSIQNDKIEYFDSATEMINSYYEKTVKSQQIMGKKSVLRKILENEYSKIKRIIEVLNIELNDYSDFEKYKKTGDILAANLYMLKYGLSSIALYDFYDNCETEILLDKSKSPQDNLKQYYKKYNKSKKKCDLNIERLKNLEADVNYLESLITLLENAGDMNDVAGIEEEMAEGRYLLKKTVKKKKGKAAPSYKEFTLACGIKAYVGRNNKENDYITFKIAAKDDIWLHVKNLPGSHVIIKKEQNSPVPDAAVEEAACVAAFYSKGKNDNTVTVDYTLRKYVTKPNGAKPGFVIYANEKSINVKPKDY